MIVVAGHLCLDVTPTLEHAASLEPGALVEAGPAAFTPGGAVGNVGLALARLGRPCRLVARIGDDPFGDILRGLLERGTGGAELALHRAAEATSYTVVISAVGRDRAFVHHAGANHAFEARDLDRAAAGGDVVHVGYPPLMRGLYRDGGHALAAALRRLRERGSTVSLDMAMPDPGGPSGRVDWRAFLQVVLPQVDLFVPSWQETLRMLRPDEPVPAPEPDVLAEVADALLAQGPAVVALKLGEQGFYLRTAAAERLARAGGSGAPHASWAGRELWCPSFRVAAVNTTGAGDATIAGFVAAWREGVAVEAACTIAAAAGACSVEGVAGVDGVPPWERLLERISGGWERHEPTLPDWRRLPDGPLAGPRDALR